MTEPAPIADKTFMPLKIGLFSDTYYPQINGVATSVLMLKKYLSEMGHSVYVFTTTDPLAPVEEEGVFRLPSLPFVSARRMALFFHPPTARLARQLELDIIHTHTEFSLGVFGRKLAKEMGTPQLHTMHTIYEQYTHYLFKFHLFDPLSRRAARRLSSEFCNGANQVIAPTEKVRDLLIDYGVKEKINVVPSGIELEKFRPGLSQDERASMRHALGIKPEDCVLLYVGRLAEEKNLGEVIEGLTAFLLHTPNVKFLVVGDGPDTGVLTEMVNAACLQGRVIFAGARPWNEIQFYYQLGDLFINASQSESQGLTYLEALAAHLPLLVKEDRCLDKILENGKNGYGFRDQQGMMEGLSSLLADNGRRLREMAAAAAKTAEKYSARQYAIAVSEIYTAILAAEALEHVS